MNTREANGVCYIGPYKTEEDAQESALRWAKVCTGGAVAVNLGTEVNPRWYVYRKGTY